MAKLYSYTLSILLFFAFTGWCHAQTPQYFKGGGTGSNSFPFSSTTGLKTQHLYLPGDLPGAVSGTITRLYFRTVTPNATASFTNFYLRLGQTTATQFPGSGLTFATGLTDVVYGATYTVTATTTGDWFYIDLQNSFVFDATQSLILEVVWTTKTAGGFNVRTSGGPSAPNNKRLTSNSATATTGSASANWMDFGIELANPLNITVSNFSATASKEHVNLRWKTANESEIVSYDVQRSDDGINYRTTGSVACKNGSSGGADYEFTDVDVFKDGMNSCYYRLKINGLSSKTVFSNVIRVVSEEDDAVSFSVFPNPFTESISVSVQSQTDATALCCITDLTGRCVSSRSHAVKKGRNVFSLPESNLLLTGHYFLTVVHDGKSTTHRILKR